MPNFQGTTRAQTIFLRAFRTDPSGPSVEKWPSPAILRRWLRRPGFVQAMRSIRDAMRYQADFQLLAAAASAAHAMHTSVSATDREMQTAQLNAMSSLMKLAHLRQRFAPAEPPLPVRVSALEELICTSHPQATIELLLKMFYCYTGRDLRAEVKARLRAEREAGVQRQRLVERPISTFHRGSPTPAEPEAGDEGADDWDPQAVGDIEAGGGESR